MTFSQKLQQVTSSLGIGLCVGLDPDPDRLPEQFSPDLNGISDFLHEIISITKPFAAAYKVNTAFYEAWGASGWQVLENVAFSLPPNTLRIADAKRGDIGNTTKHYAKAFFERLPFDAITLSPYMGGDTLQAYLENPDKGAFTLALTTNPGSADLQHFSDGRTMLYQKVLSLIPTWAPHKNLGAVVGATHPQELKQIRADFPQVPLLVPGIGAQGGDAQAIVDASGPHRAPVLVNVSRAIIFPQDEKNFPLNIADACKKFCQLLNIKIEK
ncbi:orotidine-5'-phosphate decarboxylase [bacterium]|nr:orotidine-5'-phosphate decarboxylase [bacterium]MBU1880570.1 orotidine-5'-phosphate decarboxylase [bacterium]